MLYISKFESFQVDSILVIVDVQKSFRKYFSEMYLHELKKYCSGFSKVYQIFDNHVDGKNVDKDYLFDNNPDIPVHNDLYHFPNQKDIIEKRYNYDVDVDFYKKILDKETYDLLKSKEDSDSLKRGDLFKTKEGTALVYIGNNHKWFQVPKKLFNLFQQLKGKDVTIVGGADSECLSDIFTSAETMGLGIKRNWKYIYTASNCPI
jgi:hypothetical protein